jgi:hypothetical protein
MNVIHALPWWRRLRRLAKSRLDPPSLDGARRRPPVAVPVISPPSPSGRSNPDRLLIVWRAVDDADPSRQGPVRCAWRCWPCLTSPPPRLQRERTKDDAPGGPPWTAQSP